MHLHSKLPRSPSFKVKSRLSSIVSMTKGLTHGRCEQTSMPRAIRGVVPTFQVKSRLSSYVSMTKGLTHGRCEQTSMPHVVRGVPI